MAKLRAIIDGFSGPAPPSPQAPAPQAPQVQPVTRGSRRPDPLEPGLLPEDRRPAPQEGVLPTVRRAVRPNLNPEKPELWPTFTKRRVLQKRGEISQRCPSWTELDPGPVSLKSPAQDSCLACQMGYPKMRTLLENTRVQKDNHPLNDHLITQDGPARGGLPFGS